MVPRPGPGECAASVAALVAAALAVLPAGYLLHYLTISGAPSVRDAAWAAAAAALAAAHAALVYGPVYAAIGARVPPGFGAPLVALLGAVLPTMARIAFLPRPHGAPAAFVGVHAYLVELALGVALALLALGTGRAWAPAAAAALLWAERFLVHPVFFGGVVPVLELFSALASAVAVSLVLRSALAPHRDALMEVP